MQITVNGSAQVFDESLSLLQLLEKLELKADRCAIELNRELVRRSQWKSTLLKNGDELEIVQFVGGG